MSSRDFPGLLWLQLQGKQELCKSNSDCKKAYDSLTKSAVAALNCFLELKDVITLLRSSIYGTVNYQPFESH